MVLVHHYHAVTVVNVVNSEETIQKFKTANLSKPRPWRIEQVILGSCCLSQRFTAKSDSVFLNRWINVESSSLSS
jgi:hypothetical protein